MFENKEKTPLDGIGEFKLIKHLTKGFDIKNKHTLVGNGDDAAAIDTGITVISTDLLVEHVHFDVVYTPLMHLGYKAVVVNLSDICAMNANPTGILVSIAASSKYTLEALEELYAGIKAASEKYNVELLGGDTATSAEGLTISITAIGQVESKDQLVKRSGAKPGELLCVTGDLGGAYAGLQLLEREKRVFLEAPEMQPDLDGKDYIIGRQLRPEARVDLVDYFKSEGIMPTSMIDVSDGLASEVKHLCEASGISMKVYEEKIPIDPLTYQTARDLNMDPSLYALSGGEDYELLFTLKQEDYDKIKHSSDISVIGYCADLSEGIELITKSGNVHPLQAQGWDSFIKE